MDSNGNGQSQTRQYYHARYRDKDENIFSKIQKQPIPDIALDEPTQDINYRRVDLFPLYQQLQGANTDLFQDFEYPYVHFFLEKLPLDMGFVQFFPPVFGTIFAHAMSDEGLRYMMLSISSFLVDSMAERPPLRAYKYLQLGISRIQQTLTGGDINDALIYSIFLAAYLHLIGGELTSTRRHLEGLQLLFQRLQTDTGEFLLHTSPELVFVWRMAIQMDHHSALGDQDVIFPPMVKKDESWRPWIQTIVDPSHPEMVEWALAQFALDDLLTRAISINKKATQLRSNSNYDKKLTEAAIRMEASKLLEEHQAWNNRPCVKAAAGQQNAQQWIAEENQELSDEEDMDQFLHYPPLIISDKLYGAIIIQYHWVLIYITLITHPQPGPYTYERFQAAIDVCRKYVAIGQSHVCGILRIVLGLYLTGLTLGEPMYPKGTALMCHC